MGVPLRPVSLFTVWGPPSGQFVRLLYGPPEISFFAYYNMRASLRSVSSPTMEAPLDQFLRILFRGHSQTRFFAYYMGAAQISFFAYYRGGGGAQISFFAYYMGPPQVSFFAYYICAPPPPISFFAYYIAPPPSDQFFAYYKGPPQISFFAYYMGPLQINSLLAIYETPLDKFLRKLYGRPLRSVFSLTIGVLLGGPLRSVSSQTIWGPPQINFFS